MDNKYETKKTFLAILHEKDPDLYDTLSEIKRKGFEEWVPLLSFDLGSHSGYPHLLNVERNANKMIPDYVKENFSSGEIFLLLSSIFLHDIGKLLLIPPKKKRGYKVVHHQKESKRIIEECWAELGLPDERIAKYCALISWYHGIENPFLKQYNIRNYQMFSLEPYGLLRIPFIATILRIADETENVWTRSLQEYLYERIKKYSSIQLVKGVRRYIEDVEFCLQGECIILHIPALYQFEENPEEEPTITPEIEGTTSKLDNFEIQKLNEMKTKVVEVLANWSSLLKEEGIFFSQVFFKHRNRLLVELRSGESPNGRENAKLNDIFLKDENDKRPGVQELLDAVVKLSLGSMGHDSFNWKSFEAKVGYILTEREKWILQQMNFVTQDFYITFLSKDQLKIHLNRKQLKDIYTAFGCNITHLKR